MSGSLSGTTLYLLYMNKQDKHWVFTLNNYTEEEYEQLVELAESEDVSYAIYGKETGDSGTPHIQGYIRFARKKRFNGVRRILGKRAHIECKKGTPTQASDYCKKDGDYQEFGCRATKPGRRTDLEELYLQVKEGKTRDEIGDTFTGSYIRYKRSIDELIKQHHDTPRTRTCTAPTVIVHWGLTGTGKTRAVWDEHWDDLYAHGGDRWLTDTMDNELFYSTTSMGANLNSPTFSGC
ncbi:replication-associated protein [Circoviridae 9 LDMD-2013]|uniref:replication-associated protein n=1 Tax=Circoviridae 9 LDMD-2013 TaxID=1379713 RepID=UPI0003844EFF|nr:replication-associated protein [Circoviridae 9 LDMD-2013]AGS36206.1 replication-associated protein [Circoviridae 9 LDMD-2013]